MTTYYLARIGRSNTAHIIGLAPRGNYGEHAGTDQGRGIVEYLPESACSAVSRSSIASRRYVGPFRGPRQEFATPDAVAAYAGSAGWPVCKKCAQAAAALEEAGR